MPKFDIEGFPENRISFQSAVNLKENTEQGIRQAFFVIGKDLISTFNHQVLKGKKSGRIYIRRDRLGRKRRHRASAPGESPANRTGNYRKSVGYHNRTSELVFGLSAKYADFLEVGTSRMAPRPGLRNAINKSQRNTLRELADGISNRI